MEKNIWQRGHVVFNDLFGVNGFWGQIFIMALGTIPPVVDLLVFGIKPAESFFLLFAGLIIILPLMTPAKGVDKKEERVQLFILTFGTSGVFGAIVGLAIASSLIGQTEPRETIVCCSAIWAGGVCISMFLAYFQVGFLSRAYLHGVQEQLAPSLPPDFAAVLTLLNHFGRPCTSRRLLAAFWTFRFSAIFDDDWETMTGNEKFTPQPVPKASGLWAALCWTFNPRKTTPAPPLWAQTLAVVEEELAAGGHDAGEKKRIEQMLAKAQRALVNAIKNGVC